MDIKSIKILDYFEFRKYFQLWSANFGVFESFLNEKLGMIMRLVALDKSKEEIVSYCKSVYVSEIYEAKGIPFICNACESLKISFDSVTDAIYKAKKANEEIETQINLRFSENESSLEKNLAYTNYKDKMIKYADKIIEGDDTAEDTLQELSDYFIKKMNIININPSEKDFFIFEYDRNTMKLIHKLGFNNLSEINEMSVFEFLSLVEDKKQVDPKEK